MSMTLVNHVGITVPDIDAAYAWYRDVLGMYPHVPPLDVRDDGSYLGTLVQGLFGEDFGHVRMAHLTASDGIGIELFEFVRPATKPQRPFQYWQTGIFHFCLTVADTTTTAAMIETAGGRQLSRVWRLFDDKDCEVVYCQDPWGTVIELCNRSYENVWAGRHQTT